MQTTSPYTPEQEAAMWRPMFRRSSFHGMDREGRVLRQMRDGRVYRIDRCGKVERLKRR